MDVVWYSIEVTLHQVKSKMCDCLCDYFQILYALFGQFVQAIVSVVISVVLAEVEQVILAENA